MKKLQDLTEAKILSKKEQQSVKGGFGVQRCKSTYQCPEGYLCVDGLCLAIPLV